MAIEAGHSTRRIHTLAHTDIGTGYVRSSQWTHGQLSTAVATYEPMFLWCVSVCDDSSQLPAQHNIEQLPDIKGLGFKSIIQPKIAE